MKEDARKILLLALNAHRDQVLQNRACCLGLLKDYGGNQHPEVTMLADCVEHRVARRLSELARKQVDVDVITAIADDFHAKTFYDTELCRWAVESWAIGFDVKHPPLSGYTTSTKGTAKKPAPPADLPLRSADVSFDLKQNDLDALKCYLESRSNEKERHRRYLHLISAGIGVLVAIVAMSQWWSRIAGFIVTWAFLFYAVIGILRLCEWIEARLATRKLQRGVLSRHTIKISNEGIFEKTPFDSQSCTWAVVHWFHVDAKHLFIAVPSGIHVIPLNAFGTNLNSGLTFIELIKTFFEASRTDATRDATDKPPKGRRNRVQAPNKPKPPVKRKK